MELTTSAFNSLMGIRRKKIPSVPWENIPQPVPLVIVESTPVQGSKKAIRYTATGITPEAETILSQLPAPLYMVAFVGFGRSGKSYTASKLRSHIVKNSDHQFKSQNGNVPCTHGIDMMVFKNPEGEGHFVFLDCEGGGNHNQTAIPFVIGLAARLSSRMYVFESGCFTTAGLDTVMQVVNMGRATSITDVDITQALVFVENMSYNADIPNQKLLEDLLSESDGDESTNRMRNLITSRFDVEFAKLPFNVVGHEELFNEKCGDIADILMMSKKPFIIGNVPVDGTTVIQLVNELVSQIRQGGSRYDMVSATEAMVANMASEAANSLWTDFVDKIKRSGNHPSQINGRKHLRVIMREIEGAANSAANDLDAFISRLHPYEPALLAKTTWERNFRSFEEDLRASHARKAAELQKYNQWFDRVNQLITELIQRVIDLVRQVIRFAKLAVAMVIMSNYYLFKHSMNLVSGVANGVIAGVRS
ncbi:hypothetical protein HDU97_004028 [Phlyctochytrium planicorne]|nr:hypothetical protein HDU97_004028 [Phlyctochytrium planicorne]